MRKTGLFILFLAVLGLLLASQEGAFAQVIGSTPEVPTIKGETPAFTAKGFEFFFTGFVGADFLYSTAVKNAGYQSVTPEMRPRGPVGTTAIGGGPCVAGAACLDGVSPDIRDAAITDNIQFLANNTQWGFGVKGPGLWGGTSRAFLDFANNGPLRGVTSSQATAHLGVAVQNMYMQFGWPHAVTGFGDFSVLIGKTAHPIVLLMPEVTDDILLLGTGAYFSWAGAQLTLDDTIRLGEQNRVILTVGIHHPASGVIGNTNLNAFGSPIGAATGLGEGELSAVPNFTAKIRFQSDLLGRVNYFGGLVPFEIGVAGVVGREEYQTQDSTTGLNVGQGKIGFTPWLVAGDLVLPIIGTKTEKRKGILSVKGVGWYGENLDGWLASAWQGVVARPRTPADVAAVQAGTLCPGPNKFPLPGFCASAVQDPSRFEFDNMKARGGFITIQWNPLENLLLYGILSGEWTHKLPPGTFAISGIPSYVWRGRGIMGGFYWNLNSAFGTGLEFRYLRADFNNTRTPQTNSFGGHGEEFTITWGSTYAF